MARRLTVVAAAFAAAALLGGCAGAEARAVPDVTGYRLDVAKDDLEASGLAVRVLGGGLLGVVVASHWVVCEQEPEPGALATRVTLVVARSCPTPPPRNVT